MGNVNNQFILSMSIIALGYIFKRLNIITEKDGEGIARIIFNITLPALVITTFSQMAVDFSLISLSIMQLVYGLALALIALVLFRKESTKIRGMLSMTLPGFNIGLFAYPLVESIWGQAGLMYIAMFDMGNSIVIFAICFALGSLFASSEVAIDYRAIIKRISRSIPLITYIVTLTFNFTGINFPNIFINLTAVLSRANMPLSLLLVGIYLSFSFESSYWKSIMKILSLRYSLGLAFGILLFFFTPFDPILSYTFLIAFILPIGMSSLPYAVEFDYNRRFVGTLVNITMIISFFLMWLIFKIAEVL